MFPNQKYVNLVEGDNNTKGGDATAKFQVTSQNNGKGFRFRISADVGDASMRSKMYVIEEIVTGAPPAITDDEGNHIANIKIWRQTDVDSLVASFYPGSAIRAQDLNNNFEQLRNAIQEGRCSIPDGVLVLLGDYWDRGLDTITSTKDWVVSDDRIATTAAIDSQIEAVKFPEAPVDGLEYARKNAAWSEVTGFPEAPTDGKQYGRQSSSWTVIDTSSDGVPEAPEDGTIYGRKNADWVEVPTGGGGGGGQVNTVEAGDDITVDSTDAINPRVSVTTNSFLPYNISNLVALP